jgi:hypothetical protein
MYMELTEINGRHKIVYKSDKGKVQTKHRYRNTFR